MKNIITLIFTLAATSVFGQSFEWARAFGGSPSQYNESNDIAVDALGNVYSIGKFQDSPDFDPGPDSLQLTSAGGEDMFIHKMDADGNLVWVKSVSG